ncbi:TonB-dependent receptor [Desulfosarcina variabilis str. Montpellier]
MKMEWKRKLCLLVCCVAMATPAAAEDKKKVQLDEVVVTATRTEKDAASAPASVSVVTQEDIEKSGVRSVDEAVSHIAGAYGPRGIKGGMMDSLSGGGLTLRGVPRASNTLFMVDGIILNDSYSGSQRSSLAVAPQNVDRIEVVKGPFSSLYGGYAVGGVVNIMTRMPEELELMIKSGYGSSFDRGESPDDVATFYVSGGDKIKDKLSVLLSYGYNTTNGYPTNLNQQSTMPPEGISGWQATTDTSGDPQYLIGDRGDKTWWDDNLSFKAGYDFSEQTQMRLSFTNSRFEYDYDDPHTYLEDENGNPVWSYENGRTVREGTFLSSGRSYNEERRYGLTFDTELSIFQIKAAMGYVDRPEYYYLSPSSTSATRDGGGGTVTETPSSSYNVDLQTTFPMIGRQTVTIGGALKHGEANTRKHNVTNWDDEDSKTDLAFQAKGQDRTWSIFAQDEIALLDSLTTYIGFRQDWWETYDGYANSVGDEGYPTTYTERGESAFSPKAALVYQPFDVTTLRASMGRSFRPPTLYELYTIWIYGEQTTMADPHLKPETTTSWDVGIEQHLWEGAKIGVTYFDNKMEDLIYNQTLSDTLIQRTNVGEAESHGVEIEIEQRVNDGLKLFANYTYTDSEVTKNDAEPEMVGKQLVQVPEHMFNVGGSFRIGDFSGSLTGQYVSKRYRTDDNSDEENDVYQSYDPYFVADVRVAYQLTSFAEISLSVDNILDEDYFSYYKAPGRSWFAGLTLTY